MGLLKALAARLEGEAILVSAFHARFLCSRGPLH
jgi:hypothetical protein